MNKASKNVRLSSPVRLSFPRVWEPAPVMIGGKPAGEPCYSAGLVISNNQQQLINEILAIQNELVAQAWPDGNIPPQFHWAMNPGEQARPNDPNLVGCMLINARAKKDSPPDVFQRDPATGAFSKLTDRTAIYSGCEAYVAVGFFTYQTTAIAGGIGVGLNAILPTFREVGRFDNRQTAEQAFGDLPTDVGVPQAPAGMPGGAPVPVQQQQPWAQQPAQQAVPQPAPVGAPQPPGAAVGPTGPVSDPEIPW